MKNYMFFLILLSIVLGIVMGIFFPQEMISLRWMGQVFINMLKLVVLPLIFCALVSAISSIGNIKKLGSIGVLTLGYVLLSVGIAVTIGLTLLNVFKPGFGVSAQLILSNATPTDLKPMEFSSFLLSLFPPNIIASAAKYEIMPIVFFSIAFALACVSVGEKAKAVVDFFVGLRDILIKMIVWLMYLTPIGLLSLLGAAVAEASLQHLLMQSLRGMFAFILIFLGGLLFQIIWQLGFIFIVLRKSPKAFISSATNALITAFATSSSMATLPVTMLVAERQKIDPGVSRFVLPLATTINLAGTAMYEAVSALFFCQVLGFDLSISQQIGVFFAAIIAGMGATGIPEGGLITMVMVLKIVNVPTSAIGLLLPFDRILDRFRTVTNVWGDLVCANFVDFFQNRRLARLKNVSVLSEPQHELS